MVCCWRAKQMTGVSSHFSCEIFTGLILSNGPTHGTPQTAKVRSSVDAWRSGVRIRICYPLALALAYCEDNPPQVRASPDGNRFLSALIPFLARRDIFRSQAEVTLAHPHTRYYPKIGNGAVGVLHITSANVSGFSASFVAMFCALVSASC